MGDSDWLYDEDDPNDAFYFPEEVKHTAPKGDFRSAIAAYAKQCDKHGVEIRTISDQHSGFFEESGWSLRALDGTELCNVNGSQATLTTNPNQVGGVPCH